MMIFCALRQLSVLEKKHEELFDDKIGTFMVIWEAMMVLGHSQPLISESEVNPLKDLELSDLV